MPAKIQAPDADNLIVRYQAGESLKALSDQTQISRRVIARHLSEHGISLRGRSAANTKRMSRLSHSERSTLTSAAHVGRRNMGGVRELNRAINVAYTRERNRLTQTATERLVMDWLSAHRWTCTPQKAIGPYNVDLAIDELFVAVEVRYATGPGSPLGRKHRQRVEHILDAGWHVVYLLINANHPLQETAVENLLAWAQTLSSSPSAKRQYLVLWGDGTVSAKASAKF